MATYLEIVPRDMGSYIEEVTQSLQAFPQLSGFNVPDIQSCAVRSHEGASALLEKNMAAIPHIRTIDRSLNDTLMIINELVQCGLKDVLIISGDQPAKLNAKLYPVKPITVIREAKKTFPKLNIYAALDPYRASFQKELGYCEEKLYAGADGFFTQPFFDTRLADMFLDQFRGTSLFLGISPVLSEGTYNYWRVKNNTLFPSDFSFELEYNAKLAKELIALASSYGQHVYIMPIKAPLTQYLNAIFTS